MDLDNVCACETLKYYKLMLHYLGTSIYLKFEWFSKDTHTM